jgi:hypothetical protein
MNMKDDAPAEFLEEQRRRLEDTFFLEKDKVLIEQLRTMKKMRETKTALAEVSGIKNDAVLEKLLALQIRPETLAALSLVPLVEVAWADGSVSKEEEAAVLRAAESIGVKKGNIDHPLLKEWLMVKPPSTLLEAWDHYIAGLCEKLSTSEIAALKADILGHARSVAEASGGLLGIGAVSKEEKEVLKKMEASFKGKK